MLGHPAAVLDWDGLEHAAEEGEELDNRAILSWHGGRVVAATGLAGRHPRHLLHSHVKQGCLRDVRRNIDSLHGLRTLLG